MKSVKLQLDKIFQKIERTLKDSGNRGILEALGNMAIILIVKRTKLGYGVDESLGIRSRLKSLSASYIQTRRTYGVDSTTSPSKSNLTRTGQMLSSMSILQVRDGKIVIGPKGRRDFDHRTNAEVAAFNAERGRVFNHLSLNEFNQLRRFYRKSFGDLLRKRRLIT